MRHFVLRVMIGLLLCSMSIYSTVLAAPNTHSSWISGGAKDGHGSLAFGFRNGNFGWEAGLISGGQYSSSDINDYPCPHGDYNNLGKKTVDGTYGLDALLFVDVSDTVSLYAGVGIYGQEKREIARSNVTGWLYTQSKDSDLTGAYSAGLQFHPNQNLAFGVGYHSVRGSHAQISLKF